MCRSKNKTQKNKYLKEMNGLLVQNLLTILSTIVNIVIDVFIIIMYSLLNIDLLVWSFNKKEIICFDNQYYYYYYYFNDL